MKTKYNELIADLTDKELLFHLYMTQIILFAVSFILSILLFDHFSYFNYMHWNDVRILFIGVPCGLGVVIIDIILMKWLPASYYDDGGLNERIFRNKPILQIIWIASLVAFSEELLFRGIIQTKVGLILASLIFAIIHFRYLHNWYLFLNIVLLSFFIGFIYEHTNNFAVTITMHFVIDFLLGVYIKLKWSNHHDQEGVAP